MKSIAKVFLVIVAVFAYTNSIAQIKNVKTGAVKIYGNCEMCKKTIEKAGNKKKVSKVDWNKDSKMATLIFNSKVTNEDEILKRIALAGYDNEKYLAPDEAYAKLPECCKYERKKTATVKITSQPKDEKPVQDTVKKETINPLADVYSAYFAMKDALIADNGIMANNKAKELFNAINAVPMDKLTAEQHTTWMSYMGKLSLDAEQIKSTTKVERQRESFNSLSKNMYELMKVIKPSYQVYFDHCPMYNSGKGADWLSKESGIKNPYFGAQMLGCGSTTEVIK
jgi:copper chaperone CopZ